MSTEEIKSQPPPGTACIKSEFLKTDYVRELNENFVAKILKAENKCEDETTIEPPKKKLKGQNKHRPKEKKVPRAEKLCFSIGTQGFCRYENHCCYSHDVEAYLSKKPKDISDFCYLYETFGKCPYSFSCRFSSKHIVNRKNVVNEELWNNFKDQQFTCNSLSKDLLMALRKRTYNFSKSEKTLKSLNCKDTMGASVPEKLNAENTKSPDNQSVNEPSCEIVPTINIKSEKSQTLESEISESSLDTVNKNVEQCDNSTSDSLESGIPKNGSETLVPQVLDNNNLSLETYEQKKIDFQGKLYLAPLTTVGNLPFRRICKTFGADITCGEMAMALSLLQGQHSEWALLKRHHTEDIFGVQLCGAYPDQMTRCAQLLTDTMSIDFIDINMGCPLDLVYRKGSGCGLMNRLKKFDDIVAGMSSVMNIPLTIKMRAGVYANENSAHNIIKRINNWEDKKVSLISIHGRSREQRYTKLANWTYIGECAEMAHPIPLFGSGDVLSYEDYNARLQESKISGALIARGALIKPWIFKEIKEQKHWDISSNERMDILKTFTNYGLEHWGSDSEGVEKTRRFLLEWLSFLYRYIPLGILERVPQHINERPPPYFGRNDLETLMASPSCSDWVKISEMLLGPVPDSFIFLPKHKANAYQ